jgi:hypothetical protein
MIDAFDPATSRALSETYANKPKTRTPTLTPEQALRLEQIKNQHGWIPPAQMVALARSGASDQAVQVVSEMNGKALVDAQDQENQPGGPFNWFRDKLKAASRWTFAALDFVPEFIQGGVAQWRKPGDTLFQEGWFTATTLGSMIQHPELRGTGFFKSKELMEKQGEKARAYRGEINGSAWTIGRGAANLVFKPDSVPYNVVSGLIDAAVLIKADPTSPLVRVGKVGTVGITKGEEAVRYVSEADASGALGRLKYGNLWKNIVPLQSESAGLLSEAGVIDDIAQPTVDINKFRNFWKTNGRAAELVRRIVEEKSPLRIAENIFKGRPVPNEILTQLAATDSEAKVVDLLAGLWTVGRGALPEDIRALQGNVMFGRMFDKVERVPFVNGILKSRYLTKIANGGVLVDGSTDDQIKTVQTVVRYLRTAGVDDAEVTQLADDVIREYSAAGTKAGRKTATDAFEKALKKVLVNDGHSEEAVEAMFERARGGQDRVRKYLLDRVGLPTDGGYAQQLVESIGTHGESYLPEEELAQFLKDFQPLEAAGLKVVGPTELVELLDRAVILPDLREVRRMSRNALFRELMDRSPGIAKKIPLRPLSMKKTKLEIKTVSDENAGEYDKLGNQLAQLFAKEGKTRADFAEIDKLRSAREALKTETKQVKVLTGEERAAVNALDFIQNRLWKTTALATGGFVFRNSLDAQVRMAFADIPSLLTHPFEYLSLMLGSSKKTSLLLEDLVKFVGDNPEDIAAGTRIADEFIRRSTQDVRDALGFTKEQAGYIGPLGAREHGHRAGAWQMATRDDVEGIGNHTNGMIQAGNKTMREWMRRTVLQKLVAAGYANSGDPAVIGRIADDIANGLVSDEISEELLQVRKELDALHRNGFQIIDETDPRRVRRQTPPIDLAKLPKDQRREAYRDYIAKVSATAADVLTGRVPEAQFMYAFGYVPITKQGTMVGAYDAVETELRNMGDSVKSAIGFPLEGADKEVFRVGTLVTDMDGNPGVIVKVGKTNKTDEFGNVITVREEVPVADNLLDEPLGVEVREVPVTENVYTVQPVHPEPAFDFDKGSQQARSLLESMPVSKDASTVGLPASVKYEPWQNPTKNKGRLASFEQSWDDGVDFIFNEMFSRASRRLERSPVFRFAYYREINRHAGRLRPEEAWRQLHSIYEAADPEHSKKLIEALAAEARRLGGTAGDELDLAAKALASIDRSTDAGKAEFSQVFADLTAESSGKAQEFMAGLIRRANDDAATYMGDKEIIDKLVRSTRTAGDLTVADLDAYAKWRGLQQVKELLYDASERSNIEDVLRIMTPFIAAWREILSTYARFNMVRTTRSFQRVYTGAQGADPDNDGRGIFYRDPQSNDLMFSIPATGPLLKVLTGLDVTMEAPVKRLSQGIQVVPSLGPMAQVLATPILQHAPKSRELMDLFLPYGPKAPGSAFNIVPQWAQKMIQALEANPNKLNTVYANTYMETLRALSASGDYDLSDRNQILQLEKDARFKARFITGMRALTQFTGPTSGTPEFMVPTNQGDAYASELVKAFYDIQEEYGYDNAVQEFLRRYGDDAMLYASSKTRSVRDGLEATVEFDDWARQNSDLIRQYESVGRFFAPGGSDFNFSVWSKQVEKGERVRLTSKELIDLAQQRVGSSAFRAARLAVGPYPNEQQRAALKAYRAYLHRQYPGFPEFAEFKVGEFYNQITDLKDIIRDPRLADNETAQALATYLSARDAAIASADTTEQGFRTSKNAARQRSLLENIGLTLSQQVPNFGRVYERLLASEVE